ncbi:MAG: adenosylmethionine--8-amino-7-oxononanoate transaminase [Planctomycetota bacterium]
MTNPPNDGAAAPTLERWDRDHFWHSFTQMQEYTPLVIERAKGVWLQTIDGRRLLDAASSIWCNVHGHNHPAINAAVAEQLGLVAHCTSLGMGCDTTIRLAKRLAELAPGCLNRVLFSSDGSSAVEVALKAAFQYWRQRAEPQTQRTKFLAFGQAYHGDTIGAASLGGIDRFHAVFAPLLFEAVRSPLPDAHNLPPGVAAGEAADHYLSQVAGLMAEHAGEIAAVVIEPLVQCAAGMVMHPPGFLFGLRRLCDEHDVLLIADEVAVGFGKTGAMFACEQEAVTPDFLCLGKGLTGGYLPMAATITSDEIYEAFLGPAASDRQLYHGHTFCGNPLAAAALASIDLFESDALLDSLPEKFARIAEHFDRLLDHRAVTSVRQRGMIAAAELAPDAEGRSIGRQVASLALQRGIWLRPQPDRVYVMPPLSISLEEIDHLMGVIGDAIDAATAVPSV